MKKFSLNFRFTILFFIGSLACYGTAFLTGTVCIGQYYKQNIGHQCDATGPTKIGMIAIVMGVFFLLSTVVSLIIELFKLTRKGS